VVVGGRHDQDGQAVDGGLAQAGEQLGGVGAGEVEVDQDQVGTLGLDHAHGLVEVAGRHHLVAVDQDGRGDLGDGAVVVEDQHLGRGLDGRGDLGRGLGAGPAGRPAGQVGVGRGDPETSSRVVRPARALARPSARMLRMPPATASSLMAASVALATISSRTFLVTRTTSNRPTRPW